MSRDVQATVLAVLAKLPPNPDPITLRLAVVKKLNGCTLDEVGEAVQALRFKRKLDPERLALANSEVPVPPQVAAPCGGAERGCATPPASPPITGAELAAQIDALMQRVPGLAKRRLGVILYGARNGVEQIRRRKHPSPEVVARVRAVIARPPAAAFTPARATPRLRPRPRPSAERLPRERVKKPKGPTADQRRSAAIRRTLAHQAEDRIARGLSAGSAPPGALRVTQLAIEARKREEARLADPVEQALLTLRRRGFVVFRASVYDGPADQFVLKGKLDLLTTRELFALAERHQAKAA